MICAPRSNLDTVIPVKFRRGRYRFALQPIVVEPSVSKGNHTSSNPHQHRVLLLDDNKVFLRAIGRLLEAYSFDVQTEDCHHSAFEKLSKEGNQFDLALVDVGLRWCTGWDFAKKLNRCHGTPPVMLMSGECRDRNLPTSSNVKGFISKPFSVQDLLRNISDMKFKAALACV